MIYVDWLAPYGWKLYGKYVKSCHLFSDKYDKQDDSLDLFAASLGLKLSWKQKSRSGLIHYDLVKSKRNLAIEYGAKEITKKELLELFKKNRSNK